MKLCATICRVSYVPSTSRTVTPQELAEGPFRAAMRELENIATGKEPRPRELDQFATNFAVAGENQEKVADEETLVLLKRFSRNPDVEKAKVEFERAQKLEEKFHKDFDGVDFTGNRLPTCELS